MRSAFAVLLLAFTACTPKEPVEIGSACSSSQKIEACAVGKLARCVGGTWQETTTCAGPKGCYRKAIGHGSTAAICDDARGRPGNVCEPRKQRICSEDGHAQLTCEGGRWRDEKTCARGCGWNADGIDCQ